MLSWTYARARSILGPVQALWWLVAPGTRVVINKDIPTVSGSYCPNLRVDRICFFHFAFQCLLDSGMLFAHLGLCPDL